MRQRFDWIEFSLVDALADGLNVEGVVEIIEKTHWRGVELGKRVFEFSNTGVGFFTFVRWIDEMQ